MHPKKLQLRPLLGTLPKRKADSHKGDYGHVLIVGGDFGYGGAPILAALGALRVGAGAVTVATRREHLWGLNGIHPEIMSCAIDEPNSLERVATKATSLVLGPGLGRSSWSQAVFNVAINLEIPQVIDADALFFLAQSSANINAKRIITPHPREAAVLLNISTPHTPQERLQACNRLVAKYACTAVLKGSKTLVGSPDSKLSVCHAGNPGMASGGMGDLLSGIIAGLVAQRCTLDQATKLGVILHATAGDRAARLLGNRGLIATDLLTFIHTLSN